MARHGRPPTARELRRKEERAARKASQRRTDDERRGRMALIDDASPLRAKADFVIARQAVAKDLVVGADALDELARMRSAGQLP